MNDFFKIAWRNLWRNRRRTIITISSIFFAVFIAITMRSFQLGTYNNMIDNIVTQVSGHLQIQEKDYFDNPSIDNSIIYNQQIDNELNAIPEIVFFTPRIQTGVLASSGENSKVAMIMGVDYFKEEQLSNISKRIVRYYVDTTSISVLKSYIPQNVFNKFLHYQNIAYNNQYDFAKDLQADGIDTTKYLQKILSLTKLPDIRLSNSAKDILIGTKLAEYLELSVGDSIILIGQGFHGASAVGKYKIAGFVKFPTDGFNSRFVYMPIRLAQSFLSAYEITENNDTIGYVNYIAVNTVYNASIKNSDYDKIMSVKKQIEAKLSDITVVGWRNLNKDMIQGIQIDNASGKIILGILYLIIGFGILGTVMMMMAERKKEFGVMIALGLKKWKLSVILAAEMFYMGIIAAFSAIIFSAPIIWIGHIHPLTLHGETAQGMQQYNMEPVLPMAWFDTYILAQVAVVLAMLLVVLIYVLFKVKKIKVVNALRNN
jgi:ABC-type lipoprotein release transport system permease subunit